MIWSKKSKPNPTAIVQSYLFDTIEMNNEVIPATSNDIKLIQANPDAYRYKIQQQWQLSSLPTLTLKEVKPYVLDNKTIIAELHFDHTTVCRPQRANILQVILYVLFIWSLLGGMTFVAFAHKTIEKQEMDDQCIIWFRGGQPNKIVVDTSEYPLSLDGTMSKYTRSFLNPWHKELIDSGQCTRRNR